MNKRLEYIDIAKAFGMLFIIIAHAYIPGLRQIGYVFMVPIFFFLNGYVFNLKEEKIDFGYCKKFFIKRLKSLWLIYVIYNVIYILLHNVFLDIGFYSNDEKFLELANEFGKTAVWSKKIFNYYGLNETLIAILKCMFFISKEQLLNPAWFIPALFTADLAYVFINYISNKISKENIKKICRCVLVLCVFILGYCTHFPAYTSTGLVGVLLIYLGNLAKKYETIIKYNLKIAIICGLIVVALAPITHVGMMSNTYTDPFSFIGGSLCGTYVILYISKKIESFKDKNLLKKFLVFFGKNTFIVLALHLTAFKLVTILEILLTKSDWIYLACYPVYIVNLKYSVLYVLVGTFIPLILKYIFLKLNSVIKSKIDKSTN